MLPILISFFISISPDVLLAYLGWPLYSDEWYHPQWHIDISPFLCSGHLWSLRPDMRLNTPLSWWLIRLSLLPSRSSTTTSPFKPPSLCWIWHFFILHGVSFVVICVSTPPLLCMMALSHVLSLIPFLVLRSMLLLHLQHWSFHSPSTPLPSPYGGILWLTDSAIFSDFILQI